MYTTIEGRGALQREPIDEGLDEGALVVAGEGGGVGSKAARPRREDAPLLRAHAVGPPAARLDVELLVVRREEDGGVDGRVGDVAADALEQPLRRVERGGRERLRLARPPLRAQLDAHVRRRFRAGGRAPARAARVRAASR